jgi:hypothetical protein
VRHHQANKADHAGEGHGRGGRQGSSPNQQQACFLDRQPELLGLLVAELQNVEGVPGNQQSG